MSQSKEVILIDDRAIPSEAADCTELDVRDQRSIINLLPKKFREMALHIPAHYFEMGPDELEGIAFEAYRGSKADHIFKSLRLALWEAYDYAQANEKNHLNIKKVVEGTCTYQHFTRILENDPAKYAWILIPPQNYQVELKALYETGAKRMREILEIPIDDKTNPKIMDTQMRIHQNIEMRIHGAIIQRVDERRLNVNVNAPATQQVTEEANKAASKMSMEEVERRIQELKEESLKLGAPGVMKVEMINKRTPTIMDRNGKTPTGD